MEKEIYRSETTRKVTTLFKYLAYACAAFGAVGLIAVLIVVSIGSDWEYLFAFDSSYIIPIIIAVISAILAVLFFRIESGVSSVSMSLVLTNKRIYTQIATSKIKQFESYNLNTITYYSLRQTVTKRTAYFTFILKTPTDTARFIVDEEFYNEFVNAVNATVNVIE